MEKKNTAIQSAIIRGEKAIIEIQKRDGITDNNKVIACGTLRIFIDNQLKPLLSVERSDIEIAYRNGSLDRMTENYHGSERYFKDKFNNK